MQDDPLNEEEEIEEPLEGADAEEAEDDVPIDSDDVDYSTTPKAATAVEALEDFSIASRQKARDELQNQIEAFLARGGKIQEIEPNVTADPPKKPTPDYGGRPI